MPVTRDLFEPSSIPIEDDHPFRRIATTHFRDRDQLWMGVMEAVG